MLQYLPSVAPSKGKAAVSYLPIALLCIAGLFYLLQPEFVPIEVSAGLYTVEYVVTVLLQIVKALGVLLLHHLTDFGTDWRTRGQGRERQLILSCCLMVILTSKVSW